MDRSDQYRHNNILSRAFCLDSHICPVIVERSKVGGLGFWSTNGTSRVPRFTYMWLSNNFTGYSHISSCAKNTRKRDKKTPQYRSRAFSQTTRIRYPSEQSIEPTKGTTSRATTAIMSLTNCRFYEEKYPEIDSFVMVNVRQVW